jgi:DNA primase catalytic subunit
MWVYSGRRGVHCWISDLRARALSKEGREAIASYISVEHVCICIVRTYTLYCPHLLADG